MKTYSQFSEFESIGNLSGIVNQVSKEVVDWIGENGKMIKNKHGDIILISKDNTKRFRVDFKNSHGDKPHVHVEIKKGQKWKDAGTIHRIYPKE